VKVLDGSELAEHVLQVLLRGFLMHVCDDDNPSFYGSHSSCARLRARVTRLRFDFDWGRLGRVDFHLGVSHGARVLVV
jgi:hypothetical protein